MPAVRVLQRSLPNAAPPLPFASELRQAYAASTAGRT